MESSFVRWEILSSFEVISSNWGKNLMRWIWKKTKVLGESKLLDFPFRFLWSNYLRQFQCIEGLKEFIPIGFEIKIK